MPWALQRIISDGNKASSILDIFLEKEPLTFLHAIDINPALPSSFGLILKMAFLRHNKSQFCRLNCVQKAIDFGNARSDNGQIFLVFDGAAMSVQCIYIDVSKYT